MKGIRERKGKRRRTERERTERGGRKGLRVMEGV